VLAGGVAPAFVPPSLLLLDAPSGDVEVVDADAADELLDEERESVR
jgi:hypothetical protein